MCDRLQVGAEPTDRRRQDPSYEEVKNICLNDEGGAVMGVSYGKTHTLRACVGGHPPIVLERIDR